MSPGRMYTTKVDGCGKCEVRFFVGQKIAQAEFNGSMKNPRRKAELAVTTQGTVLGRKVVYGKRKKEQYKKFNSLNHAAKWFNKKRPEEAIVLQAIAEKPEINVTPIVEEAPKPLI